MPHVITQIDIKEQYSRITSELIIYTRGIHLFFETFVQFFFYTLHCVFDLIQNKSVWHASASAFLWKKSKTRIRCLKHRRPTYDYPTNSPLQPNQGRSKRGTEGTKSGQSDRRNVRKGGTLGRLHIHIIKETGYYETSLHFITIQKDGQKLTRKRGRHPHNIRLKQKSRQ